ncbi:MAG: hypothetical protein NZ561_07140 [Phycisphaerae bacterium]|nr:hypothetical protein [Phycisphaerae bacterium]
MSRLILLSICAGSLWISLTTTAATAELLTAGAIESPPVREPVDSAEPAAPPAQQSPAEAPPSGPPPTGDAPSATSSGEAPPAEPSTPPAPAPVQVVPMDQSTPRGALKVMTQALEDGNAELARRVLLIESDEQERWAEAMLSLASAGAEVKRVSVARFGEEGAQAIVGDTAMAIAMAMGAIDRSTEELDGERAIVRSADSQEAPVELVRRDGLWRLPMKAIIGDADPEVLRETAQRMVRQVTAMRSFTADVSADKFASPGDAAQALQLRMVQAVFAPEGQSPATQPSSPAGPG